MRRAQLKNQLFDLLKNWCVEHGETIVFWRFESPKFFTCDPNIIKSMLTEINIFRKADSIPNRTLFGQRITGTNSFLTVTDGQLWAQKRKTMSIYFTKSHMTTMFDKMRINIEKGMTKLAGEVIQDPVDVVEFYGELFQYFLGALGFDLDCEYVSGNSKFHNEVIQKILKWVPQQFVPWHEYLRLKMNPDVGKTIDMITKLRNIAFNILKVKEKEIREQGYNVDDIVHHVIKANSSTRNNETKMDDMMTIFLVIDNMAKTLATFFVRVVRAPGVYEKILSEIANVDTSSLQATDKSLPYTEMAILECLRLHPTLMRGIRVTKKVTTLNNGLKVRKNSLIFFGQLILHRHPKYWDKPDDFIPERFAQGSLNITPFTYLPFVAGPRVCMGKHLAMISMKLAIVETFKRFKLAPVPGEEKEMEWDNRFTIVKPIKGNNLIFTPI